PASGVEGPGDAGRLAARKTAGLPSAPGQVLFCSYNQFFKIDRSVLEAWAQLLREVPNASLVLVKFLFHAQAERRLKGQLAQLGADPSRLLFAKKLPTVQHLQR
ncbi:hypothetical protein T484DRAFT_1910945, partial [Baffinella frigidus]